MRYVNRPAQNQEPSNRKLCLFKWIAATAAILIGVPAYAMQNPAGTTGKPAGQQTAPGTARRPGHAPAKKRSPSDMSQQDQKSAEMEDFQKLQPVIQELGPLMEKLKAGVQLPPSRFQSRLLPLLPASTVAYFSIPNYGEALHQAQQIFHQQLPESPAIREWWEKLQKDNKGPSIDETLEKIHQFSQYLGSEIVVSVGIEDKGTRDGAGLLLAEVQKPGLDVFIHDLVAQHGKEASGIHIFNPQELMAATVPAVKGKDHVLVLVRPDFLAIGSDLASLQQVNADLEHGGGRFNSSPFGQRLTQAYQGGIGTLVGANLQQILSLRPKGPEKDEAFLRQSGFDDLKYLIMERKDEVGKESSRMELSFNGPRHGMASWLAPAAPMGGLDFISGNPTFVISVLLKNPAQIFDEIKAMAASGNSQPNPALGMIEAMNLRDTLLSKLTGELAIAVNGPIGPDVAWMVVLKANDAPGLEKTIEGLITNMGGGGGGPALQSRQEGGTTYHTLQVPAGPKLMDITFASADGYLLIGPGQQKVMEAIQTHKSGRSIAKTGLSGMLPQEHRNVSAVFYEDLAQVLGPFLAQINPALAQMQASSGQSKPYTGWIYAEDSLLQMGSNTQGADMAMIPIIAAVAIPNLLRSRMAANEAAAASTVRTMNTTQVVYSTTYPSKGYAQNLAALGPGPNQSCDEKIGPNAAHACLLDAVLGCASGTWCTKGSYRYSMSTRQRNLMGVDYVVVATPIAANKGSKSYCSTSDAVVRWKAGPPLAAPVTVTECQRWQPL